MVIVISLILLILAAIIYLTYWTYQEVTDGIIGTAIMSVLYLIFGGLIAFIIIIVSVAVSTLVPNDEQNIKLVKTESIVALKDNIGTKGSFYLGSGITGGNQNYFYVTKTKRGYKQEKVEADNTYIHYTKDNFRIEKHEGVSFKNWYTYIYATTPTAVYYEIYIPENSITRDFEIDLE